MPRSCVAPQSPRVTPACMGPLLRGNFGGTWRICERPLRGGDFEAVAVGSGSKAPVRGSSERSLSLLVLTAASSCTKVGNERLVDVFCWHPPHQRELQRLGKTDLRIGRSKLTIAHRAQSVKLGSGVRLRTEAADREQPHRVGTRMAMRGRSASRLTFAKCSSSYEAPLTDNLTLFVR